MNHYVYLSYEENGRMYIGSRSSADHPEEDLYFGSFTDKTFKPIKKKILKTFVSREDADVWESYLHEVNSVDTNPKFANQVKQRDPPLDARFLSLKLDPTIQCVGLDSFAPRVVLYIL